jgi:hypothetical protein
MATSLDLQKVKPLPIQKSLMLINNFVINTTQFLNAFSETCEKRLSFVSSKATELEILLAVLEAKLNSIPGLEGVAAASAPQTYQQQTTSSSASTSGTTETASSGTASVPSAAPTPSPAPVAAAAGGIPAKDHPSYLPFFKMVNVGIPIQAVQLKMGLANPTLDPSILETPDKIIPA